MNRKHLNQFSTLSRQDYCNLTDWEGSPPKEWASYAVGHGLSIDTLPLKSSPISRSELFAICRDGSIGSLQCCVSIFAWGGMNRKYGLNALREFDSWKTIVDSMREGELGAMDAFSEFTKLRQRKRLPGMGIAYFTKLIFFCSTRSRGYILDQWTARSANLLSDFEMIKLTWGGSKSRRWAFVNDYNTHETYADFCALVEGLDLEIDHLKGPDEIEKAMFSAGRGKGMWRKYVVENYSR